MRSSVIDQRQKNRLTLFATLALFAVCVWFFSTDERRFFFGRGKLDVVVEGDVATFGWKGDVRAPMSRRIREAFDEVKNDVSVILLDLNSPGGEIAEGARVIDELERIQRTHAVDTRVGFKRNCLSMCVPIFMEGENRIAAANARFMFHQPSVYDMVTEERVDVPEMERRLTTARFYRRYFEGSVMNEAWGEQLKIDWEGKDVWKTGRELVDEGSGLVTALE